MKKFKILFFAFICLVAQSCSNSDNDLNPVNSGGSDNPSESTTIFSPANPDTLWANSEDDANYDVAEIITSDDDDFIENSTFSKTISINYDENSASATTSVDGVTITISGANVEINSTIAEVKYILSGTTTNGSFKIYSSKKYCVELNGVNITNNNGPAINSQSGKRAFYVVANGSENYLSDNATYANIPSNEDAKACFFSEGQIIISGSGNLTINGKYKHGICSDDYVRLRSGTNVAITAASDGVHANDAVIIGGGNISITSGSDAIEAEKGSVLIKSGNITIKSDDDGIVTSYDGTDTSLEKNVEIQRGKITITTTSEKAHGINAVDSVVVKGGVVRIKTTGAASKCIKSDTHVDISGSAKITLVATGNAMYDSSDADISSPAAIKCDGNFTFANATLETASSGLAGKGISCDGDLIISSGTVNISTSGKQYVYNKLDSSAKGIKAEGNLIINGGNIAVATDGGEGSEGIESKKTLTINNGTVKVCAYDDCLNASNAIVINGGSVYCYSSNNDGIDSNGTLTVTGGLIVSAGTTQPEGGIDCDNNTFKITGGTILGIGGTTSNPTSNVCTQRSVVYGGSGSKDQIICIKNSSDNTILAYKIPRTYSQMTLLFSSSTLEANKTYTIYKDGNLSGGENIFGYYSDATYSGGSKQISFTTSNMVTKVGNTNNGGKW